MRLTALLFLLSLPALAQSPAGDPSLDERLKKAGAEGRSVETGAPMADEAVETDRVEARLLRLRGADLAATVLFSDNGSEMFVAERTGVIRKILTGSWTEARRLWVGDEVAALAKYKEGILAAVPAKKELLAIERETLSVKARIAVEQATGIVATPNGLWGWSPCGERGMPLELQKIDLEFNRKIFAKISALEMMKAQGTKARYLSHGASKQLSTFENLAVTPKGDVMLATSSNCIFRLRLSGAEVEIEEAGAPLGKLARIALSPDGQQVAAEAPIEKVPDGHPPVQPYGSYVFWVKNLQKPHLSLPEVRAWGFNRTSQQIYGVKDPATFVVVTTRGKIEDAYELSTEPVDLRIVAGSPANGRFVVATADRVEWIRFK
jgi:hypothetical protein